LESKDRSGESPQSILSVINNHLRLTMCDRGHTTKAKSYAMRFKFDLTGIYR
jgi:hypothetical protein